MHFLAHRAHKHAKLLLIHLNKELALLGIVAFLLLLLETIQFPSEIVVDLKIFEWCHIVLFFVALLTIVSHVILNVVLWWQERHVRSYDQGSALEAAAPRTGQQAQFHLHFQLARYVFLADRRQFFTTQQLRSPHPRRSSRAPSACPSRMASCLSSSHPGLSPERSMSAAHASRPEASSSGLAAYSREASAELTAISRQQSALPKSGSACGHEVGAAPAAPAAGPGPQDLQHAERICTSQCISVSMDIEPDEAVQYLADQLQTLRVPPGLARQLRSAVKEQMALREFSFADYLVLCARKQLVKLLHVGWMTWTILLLILALYQIPFQLFHGNSSLPNAFTTTTGCVLLSLFYVMWVKMKLSHGRCIKQLAEAALLHFAREGLVSDDEWLLSLEPVLTACPQLTPLACARAGDLSITRTAEVRLAHRQRELYQRSIRCQKKAFRARFMYPRNVSLTLQVLIMWLGLHFAFFLMTALPRAFVEEWTLSTTICWIVGLGAPVAVYSFLLPSIMFYHTFLVSVGDLIDLKAMRQIEQEHREKLRQQARCVQRRRLL
eukprot:EG_transcript_2853